MRLEIGAPSRGLLLPPLAAFIPGSGLLELNNTIKFKKINVKINNLRKGALYDVPAEVSLSALGPFDGMPIEG